MHTERRSFTSNCSDSCRADNGFRWNTAHVQTIAAHQIALNQRNFCAEPCSAGRSDEPRRARADDNQIIAAARCRVYLIRRVNV